MTSPVLSPSIETSDVFTPIRESSTPKDSISTVAYTVLPSPSIEGSPTSSPLSYLEASKTLVAIRRNQFFLKKTLYEIRNTEGEGSCALHALLGSEIDGRFTFSEEEDSSALAKASYLSALSDALNRGEKQVEEVFREIISNYLNDSLSSTSNVREASYLFSSCADGKELRNTWDELKHKHLSIIEPIKKEEADLWKSFFLGGNRILDESIVAAAQKKLHKYSERFRDVDGLHIPQDIVDDALKLLDIIEESPESYFFLLNEEQKALIEAIRSRRKEACKNRDSEQKAFVLREEILNLYTEKLANPRYFLTTNELKLAAILFNKKLQIVARQDGIIHPSEPLINEELEEDPIIVYHEGAHFERCTIASSDQEDLLVEVFQKSLVLSSSGTSSQPLRSSSATDAIKHQAAPKSRFAEKKEKAKKRECFKAYDAARDTRKHRVTIENVEDFKFEVDKDTKEVYLSIPIEKAATPFMQSMVNSYIDNEQYAFASRYLVNDTIPTLKWKEQALRTTANKKAKEKGKEFDAARDKDNAKRISDRIKLLTERYNKSIEGCRLYFSNCVKGNIHPEKLLDYYFEANKLNPKSFTHHAFALVATRLTCLSDEEITDNIIESAYEICPLKTFNFLIASLSCFFITNKKADKEKTDHIKSLAKSIYRRYPEDLIFIMFAVAVEELIGESILDNANQKEESLRENFAASLSAALELVREKKFSAAYEAFSDASALHISDKRPYYYRALIDIKEGYKASAKRQLQRAKNCIHWCDKEEKNAATFAFARIITDTSADLLPTFVHPEHKVVEALEELIESKPKNIHKNLEAFKKEISTYLENPKADLIWAELAIDIGINKIETENLETLELNQFIICAAYQRLKFYKEEDLEEYADLIKEDEEGQSMLFSPQLFLTHPLQQLTEININTDSLLLQKECNIKLFNELLFSRCADFTNCLLSAHHYPFESILDTIETIEDSDEEGSAPIPIFEPLFERCLHMLSKEGSFAQRLRFLNWLKKNPSLIPETKLNDLKSTIYRWLLDQPLPMRGINALKTAASLWVNIEELDAKEAKSNECLAVCAWHHFHNGNLTKAAEVMSVFFNQWEDRLDNGIDRTVLRAFLILKFLLANPEIAKTLSNILSKAKEKHHLEMIACALSLVAKEARPNLCVIPEAELTSELLETLSHYYFGQKRGESDEDHLKRLISLRMPDEDDLRSLKKMKSPFEERPKEANLVAPFHKRRHRKIFSEKLEEEIALLEKRISKNKEASIETPDYLGQFEYYSEELKDKFLKWVIDNPQLIDEYMKNKEKFMREFNKTYPKFPVDAKDQFEKELESKHNHFQKALAAKKPPKELSPNSVKSEADRFWQLVHLTAKMIETVLNNDRAEEDYDIVVANEQEALLVKKLLCEWSELQMENAIKEIRKSVKTCDAESTAKVDKEIQKLKIELAEAFHGPEVHLWGKGPRLPHFNAGVFKNSSFSNVHIYFDL